jgi:hypothetical protein
MPHMVLHGRLREKHGRLDVARTGGPGKYSPCGCSKGTFRLNWHNAAAWDSAMKAMPTRMWVMLAGEYGRLNGEG